MDLIEFKTQIFDGSLKPAEIAVVLFIALQDRSRYVFYKSVMMHALGIKDIRTLNNVLQKLIDKKIIKQVMTRARGFLFSIIGLDEDNGQDAEQEGKGSNEAAEGTAAKIKNEEPARVEGYAAASSALEPVPDKSQEEDRQVPQVPPPISNKFKDLTDLSEMPTETKDALTELMKGFST